MIGYIIVGCIGGVVLVGLLVLLAVYFAAFFNKSQDTSPYDYNVTPQILEIKETFDEAINAFLLEPYIDVETEAEDGVILHARYYQHKKDAPLAILLHGYRGQAIRDWAGTFYIYRRMGFSVLLVDQRAHGQSKGYSTTFGNKEHLDCLKWIAWSERELHAQNILLTGVSMGGATVINASPKVPKSVKCIIADCPYDTPKNIVSIVVSGALNLNAKILYPIIKCSARIFGGFDLDGTSPLSAIKDAVVPILLIHGEADDFVPASMSVALHDVAPQKSQLHLVNGAGHTLSRLVAPDEYEGVVRAFVKKHLKENVDD